MRRTIAAVCLVLAGAGFAQDNTGTDNGTIIISPIDGSEALLQPEPQKVLAKQGLGAMLKGLDKVSGIVSDLALALGDTAQVGRIEVDLVACRYPEDNPAGEAFAWLTIRDSERQAVLFDGWMVASSPALNALDHSRYDVWVIRCTTA